jgi:hypothetical protein
MSEREAGALVVELFLANARVQGITHEVQDRRRLIDVLIGGSPSLRLEDVKVQVGLAVGLRELPVMNVEKQAIIAAVPHETKQQMQQRSLLTNTIGRAATRAVAATLLVPPFVIEGKLHVPQSMGDLGSRLTPDPTKLAAFVSVTDARLTLPGGAEVATSVLLVSRERIAGISVPDERQRLADAS